MTFVKTGEKDGYILLSDSNGNSAYFEFLEMAVLNGKEYAALVETENDDLIILSFSEDSCGTERYTVIDDDDEFELVSVFFENMFNEE